MRTQHGVKGKARVKTWDEAAIMERMAATAVAEFFADLGRAINSRVTRCREEGRDVHHVSAKRAEEAALFAKYRVHFDAPWRDGAERIR